MSRPSRESDRLAKVSGVAAVVWGAALLAVGRRLWASTTADPPGNVDQLAVRALGARHLLQGVAQASAPALGQRFFVAVDVVHAASMVWLAAVDERRRRPALVSAAAAVGAAALTLAARRRR